MEKIKGELGSLVITGDNQHGYPPPAEIQKGPDQFIEYLPRNVVFVKEISAMNEKIGFNVYRVLYNRQKVFKNGVGPSLTPLGVSLDYLGNLESKMGISSMNKLQWNLLMKSITTPKKGGLILPLKGAFYLSSR